MLVEKGWFITTLQFGPDDVFFVEDWDETPVGPYCALVHFTPDDHRTLYVSSEAGKELISTIHRCDEKVVTEIDSLRSGGCWTIGLNTGDKGELRIEVDYKETALLKLANPIVSYTPEVITRSPLYCRIVPRLAAPVLGTDPDQKMMGLTEMGRETRFRFHKIFMVPSARCSWGGKDIGPMTDCCYAHDMGDHKPTSKPVVVNLSLIVD